MSWNFIPVNGPYIGTSEGPVWDGQYILFTHIPGSIILQFDPKTSTSTIYIEGTNHAMDWLLMQLDAFMPVKVEQEGWFGTRARIQSY